MPSIGPRRCCYFEAGEATRVQFSDQAEVPVRRAVSFWVESRGAGGTRRTPRVNVTLGRWGEPAGSSQSLLSPSHTRPPHCPETN